jgi:hypothetical protein
LHSAWQLVTKHSDWFWKSDTPVPLSTEAWHCEVQASPASGAHVWTQLSIVAHAALDSHASTCAQQFEVTHVKQGPASPVIPHAASDSPSPGPLVSFRPVASFIVASAGDSPSAPASAVGPAASGPSLPASLAPLLEPELPPELDPLLDPEPPPLDPLPDPELAVPSDPEPASLPLVKAEPPHATATREAESAHRVRCLMPIPPWKKARVVLSTGCADAETDSFQREGAGTRRSPSQQVRRAHLCAYREIGAR